MIWNSHKFYEKSFVGKIYRVFSYTFEAFKIISQQWLAIKHDTSSGDWISIDGDELTWFNWMNSNKIKHKKQQAVELRHDGFWSVTNKAERRNFICVIVVRKEESARFFSTWWVDMLVDRYAGRNHQLENSRKAFTI